MNKETQAALAAGQSTAAPAQPAAQQGAAYAALPTSNYAGRVYEEGFLIGTCPLYTADQLHAFADATHTLRASHGQAPAQLAQRFDATGMATAAAQGFRDGVASVSAGWQSIETAPKDGQAILVTDGRGCYCVEWSEEFDWWTVDDNKLGPFRLRGSAPTHWMPTPAAPQPSYTAQAADSVQEDAARYRLLRRGRHWSVIDGIGNDLLRAEALDAAVDAARKQGEKQ